MKRNTMITAAAGAALLLGSVAVAQTTATTTEMDASVERGQTTTDFMSETTSTPTLDQNTTTRAYPSDQSSTYQGYQSGATMTTRNSARIDEYANREGRMSERGYMVYGEESGYSDRGSYRGYQSGDAHHMAGERG